MLPRTLVRNMNTRRLAKLLAVFFLALAIPTAVLVWQVYGQLKWEAFHQHRGSAEELTRRLDTELGEMIRSADARSFADYTFLVVSGDPSANFVQRSPLSVFPVAQDLPGVIGYFQVDNEGRFSTPLLPPPGTAAGELGIGAEELGQRERLAQSLQDILADNRLVQARRLARPYAASPAAPEKEFAEAEEAPAAVASFAPEGGAYSQRVFDQLNQPGRQNVDDAPAVEGRRDRSSELSELKLDADLYKKTESLGSVTEADEVGSASIDHTQARSKRREQIALPESVPAGERQVLRNVSGFTDLRISTFESEIDPFEFSVLGSGHFVLFRKVWRDDERYIQGLIVDPDVFVRDEIGGRFMETALSGMTSLIVAYQDAVIDTFSGGGRSVYPDVSAELEGELLYQSRLATPLNGLELIFSIDRLPPGPGARVLGWVTLVLAIVLVAGFLLMYRLGAGQISLARQQQDFVSAVSHELKTPLTSIRMYGEMLKEGWADEEKRQSYYEYIHDESERLSRLISNVLQLARITRSEPQFDMKPVAVAALMDQMESKISSQVERAGFDMKFTCAPDAVEAYVSVDEDCFAQIVINLVDNAIKFSADTDNRKIEIGATRTSHGDIRFSVRDFGPGIPPEQMQKIFELFYRSESELTRETVGTGIGLAIVHQLTLAMNGSIDLVNADPGADFRLLFPAATNAS